MVQPPAGVVVSVLPPYYTTVWLGGVPYYYADDIYYRWDPIVNGYEVVEPPPDADRPGTAPSATYGELLHLSEERPIPAAAGCRSLRMPQLGDAANRL